MKNSRAEHLHLNRKDFWASHRTFWIEHPALLSAFSILIGSSSLLLCHHLYWVFVFGIYLGMCRFYAQYILLFASCVYGLLFQLPENPPAHEITAIFSPHSLDPHISPFHTGLQTKGTLSHASFNYPCTIYIEEESPLANQDHLVTGLLKKRGPYDFVFKPRSSEKIPYTWSLAKLRHEAKTFCKEKLHALLPSEKVALFLSAMTTGDVEERLLRYEFGKLGLQHILAISGFHFAILIAFITFFLNFFLSYERKIYALFFAISLYFIFLGSSPAIERSYLTASFYLLGKWLRLPTKGLNLLGCALVAEVLYSPPVALHLGFQLSFLSCFAILLIAPLIETQLELLSPKRTGKELKALSLFSRYGAKLSSLIKQSISLTFAINLALLPLTLFHFHEFPLLGFVYNLFFPFCTGCSLFLLFTSCIFQVLFPPIAAPLFWTTNTITKFLLQLTEHPPSPLLFRIQTDALSSDLVIGYLFALSFVTIYLKMRAKQTQNWGF